MEKELKPFSEEKAKAIMEEGGLEERSQEAQEVFEAGAKHKEREMLKMTPSDLEFRQVLEKRLAQGDISEEMKDLMRSGKFGNAVVSHGHIEAKPDVSNEEILKFMRELPKDIKIRKLHLFYCTGKRPHNKLFDEEIQKEFPDLDVRS